MNSLLKVTQFFRNRIRAGTLTAMLQSSFSWALNSESQALLHPGCPDSLLQKVSGLRQKPPFSLWRTMKDVFWRAEGAAEDWGRPCTEALGGKTQDLGNSQVV